MSILENFEIRKGFDTPLGASMSNKGVNFTFFSKGERGHLKLKIKDKIFDIPLNKTGNIFHVAVDNLPNEILYAYEVDGTLLQDPWGKSFDSPTSFGEKPNKDTYLFTKVENQEDTFDWQGVKKPKIKDKDLVIYEMHVRSFSQDKSSRVKNRGSFLGIIEKIDYLKKLGITAVELMPIYEFDETSYGKINPLTKETLYNYWGYSPISFFSIMKRYGDENDLKTLIREFHRNGIEVFLDVVYNHSGNPIKDNNFYLLDENKKNLNYSGCGNTFNSNSEIGSKLILASLIYFVKDFQIDGFRFDLASILTRGENGEVLEKPPILEMIKKEKKLKDTKFIAEPWDASGLYQLGFFGKYGFYEWNDKFRDVARKFIRGDKNIENDFASHIAGKNPALNSINYVTCHDGFSLMDLMSFEKKHNLANGENNKDGSDNNLSSNSGVEGPSLDKEIQEIRHGKAKNFLVLLMISKGIPMLLMGDEYLHSRDGNNNAWCQDNSLNYFLWDKKPILKDFISSLIKFRKENFDSLSHLKLDEKISKEVAKTSDRLVILTAKDLMIIFNSNDSDIDLNLEGKYKIILATFKPNSDQQESKLTLKSYSSIILKKQD
ncbi:MAG: hypothetical protein K940chlam1_00712 [Candidatus Anoxychlamydiales bacterium]|nr:hypothetical protein [Candidatus Anoxychlamydiales bacterium]NGX36179.1 hypothetical protein [Candidatus Anoxychlamydiales bacterium]